MKSRTITLPLDIVWLLLLVVSPAVGLQMPARPGKLDISSTTRGLKITIDGKPRPEVTPVVLVVSPGTYSVVVGPCQAQSVQVSSGETKSVNCPQ